jgi:uncharacterized membrane protein
MKSSPDLPGNVRSSEIWRRRDGRGEEGGVKFSPQHLTISALLIGAALLLGLTPLGNINIPTVGGAITVMHIPAILAGILQGPFMGAVVGGIFGVTSTMQYEPHDPLVQIPSRVFIGIMAALTYMLLREFLRKSRPSGQDTIASAAAAVAGTLVNTVGTLCVVMLLRPGEYPLDKVLPTALIHGPLEILAAVIAVVPLTIACRAATHRSPFWE